MQPPPHDSSENLKDNNDYDEVKYLIMVGGAKRAFNSGKSTGLAYLRQREGRISHHTGAQIDQERKCLHSCKEAP